MRSQSRVCKSIPLDGKTISTPAQSYSFCQAFLHAYTCIRIHIYIHIYVCQTLLMLLSVKAFSCPHSHIYIYIHYYYHRRLATLILNLPLTLKRIFRWFPIQCKFYKKLRVTKTMKIEAIFPHMKEFNHGKELWLPFMWFLNCSNRYFI